MSRGRRQRRAGRGHATVHAEPGTAEPVGRRALWGAGVPGTPELPLEPTGPPCDGGVARHPGQMGQGRAQGCAATLLAQGTVPGSASEPVATGTQELRGVLVDGPPCRLCRWREEPPLQAPRPSLCVLEAQGPFLCTGRSGDQGAPRVAAMRSAPGGGGGVRGGSDSRCVVKVVFLTGRLWGVRGEPRAFSRAR